MSITDEGALAQFIDERLHRAPVTMGHRLTQGKIGTLDGRATALESRATTLEGRFPIVSADITDGTIVPADLAVMPQVRAYRSVDNGITNNTWTVVSFDAEDFDLGTPSNDMHDNTTNAGRLTCRVAGLYYVTANICFDSNATGIRAVRLRMNGTGNPFAQIECNNSGAANFTQINLSAPWRMAVNDYVEVEAVQVSGGGLNVKGNSAVGVTFFAAAWLSN